jgi:hypothetical protein
LHAYSFLPVFVLLPGEADTFPVFSHGFPDILTRSAHLRGLVAFSLISVCYQFAGD